MESEVFRSLSSKEFGQMGPGSESEKGKKIPQSSLRLAASLGRV